MKAVRTSASKKKTPSIPLQGEERVSGAERGNNPHGRHCGTSAIPWIPAKRELTTRGLVILCVLRIPLDLQSKRMVSKKCYICKKLTKGER